MADGLNLDELREKFRLGGDDNHSKQDVLTTMSPRGFTVRQPPKPHDHITFMTSDDQLFHTMHMGAAVVAPSTHYLVIDGLVAHPLRLSLSDLKSLPSTTITSFHECYGSPLKPPTTPLYRIGNVRWTGVPLSSLLSIAQPITQPQDQTYIWSTGLDHGDFFHITSDAYQKDLPLYKALDPNTLLAWSMNDEPLTKERGFPVRLVVPGWFGTNSTKWICRLSVQASRSPGPWTTELYNEIDPTDNAGKKMRPVWMAEVNSMICLPAPGDKVQDGRVTVNGRAWGCTEVARVRVKAVRCEHVSSNGDETGGNESTQWVDAQVQKRKEFEWQFWEVTLDLTLPVEHKKSTASGELGEKYEITARATDMDGAEQPLQGRRNRVHSIEIEVISSGSS